MPRFPSGGLPPLNDGQVWVGNSSNIATSVTPSGDATISNAGAVTLTNASVTGQALTGYVVGSNTAIDATDSILVAFEKLQAQVSGVAAVKMATIKEVEANGVNPGTFTSGSAVTRTLNTLSDPDSIVTSLASNQFTLPAGTYYISAKAPAYAINRHKAWLRNVTSSTNAIIGTTSFSSSGATSVSFIEGIITPTGSTTYSIQHQCQTTSGDTSGLGGYGSIGGMDTNSEVYTTVQIIKYK